MKKKVAKKAPVKAAPAVPAKAAVKKKVPPKPAAPVAAAPKKKTAPTKAAPAKAATRPQRRGDDDEYRVRSTREQAKEQAAGFESNLVRFPDDVERFDPNQKGAYVIDILGYKTKNNPRAEPGELFGNREYKAHYNLGPGSDRSAICPSTFGKPCPVCEYQQQLLRQGVSKKSEEYKALYPKRRQLFVLLDHNDKANKQPKIWDVATWNFGELLADRVNDNAEEDWDMYHHPKIGYRMRVSIKRTSMPGRDGQPVVFSKASAIDFKKRDKPIPKEIMQAVPCLDDLLVETDYETLAKLFYGEDHAPDNTEETDELDEWAGEQTEDETEDETESEEETETEDETESDEMEVPLESEIMAMGRADLIALNEAWELALDPDDYKKATKKFARAVADGIAAYVAEVEGTGEAETEDDELEEEEETDEDETESEEETEDDSDWE